VAGRPDDRQRMADRSRNPHLRTTRRQLRGQLLSPAPVRPGASVPGGDGLVAVGAATALLARGRGHGGHRDTSGAASGRVPGRSSPRARHHGELLSLHALLVRPRAGRCAGGLLRGRRPVGPVLTRRRARRPPPRRGCPPPHRRVAHEADGGAARSRCRRRLRRGPRLATGMAARRAARSRRRRVRRRALGLEPRMDRSPLHRPAAPSRGGAPG
jgi:hypothetical protein